MVELAAEGVESVRLACSWVLLLPAIGVTLFAPRRTPVVVSAFVVTAASVAWLRFAGWWFAAPRGAVQVLLGLAVIGITIIALRSDRSMASAIAAGSAGLVAAWSWIPCVGPRLGDLVNDARSAPFEHLGGTVAYTVGLLLPFVLIAALAVAFPRARTTLENRRVTIVGAAVLLVFGGLLALTLFDDIASELARRSTF